MSECEAAAQYLSLSDTSAMECNGYTYDPPYCYMDDNDYLCFNGDASNKGNCGENDDQCLCRGSGTLTTTTITTTTTTTTTATTTTTTKTVATAPTTTPGQIIFLVKEYGSTMYSDSCNGYKTF